MKKLTIYLGIISCCIFFMGSLLKILHWPGAGHALAFSIAIFAFGYSPLVCADRNKLVQHGSQRMINLASMITMILVSVSFLFKAMHWPGGGVAVMIGNLVLLVMIPLLFIRASKEGDKVKKLNSYNEAILLVFLSGFSLYMWLFMSKG